MERGLAEGVDTKPRDRVLIRLRRRAHQPLCFVARERLMEGASKPVKKDPTGRCSRSVSDRGSSRARRLRCPSGEPRRGRLLSVSAIQRISHFLAAARGIYCPTVVPANRRSAKCRRFAVWVSSRQGEQQAVFSGLSCESGLPQPSVRPPPFTKYIRPRLRRGGLRATARNVGKSGRPSSGCTSLFIVQTLYTINSVIKKKRKENKSEWTKKKMRGMSGVWCRCAISLATESIISVRR